MNADFDELKRRAQATGDSQDWQRVHALAERLGLGIDGEPLPVGAFRQVQVPGLPLTEIEDVFEASFASRRSLVADGRFVATLYSQNVTPNRFFARNAYDPQLLARVVDVSQAKVVWERPVGRDGCVYFDESGRLICYSQGTLVRYSGLNWSVAEELFSGRTVDELIFEAVGVRCERVQPHEGPFQNTLLFSADYNKIVALSLDEERVQVIDWPPGIHNVESFVGLTPDQAGLVVCQSNDFVCVNLEGKGWKSYPGWDAYEAVISNLGVVLFLNSGHLYELDTGMPWPKSYTLPRSGGPAVIQENAVLTPEPVLSDSSLEFAALIYSAELDFLVFATNEFQKCWDVKNRRWLWSIEEPGHVLGPYNVRAGVVAGGESYVTLIGSQWMRRDFKTGRLLDVFDLALRPSQLSLSGDENFLNILDLGHSLRFCLNQLSWLPNNSQPQQVLGGNQHGNIVRNGHRLEFHQEDGQVISLYKKGFDMDYDIVASPIGVVQVSFSGISHYCTESKTVWKIEGAYSRSVVSQNGECAALMASGFEEIINSLGHEPDSVELWSILKQRLLCKLEVELGDEPLSFSRSCQVFVMTNNTLETCQRFMVYDSNTGKKLAEQRFDNDTWVVFLKNFPDNAFVYTDKTEIVIADMKFNELERLRGHKYMIQHLSLTKDGKTLISADATGCILFWDVSKFGF